MPFLDKIGFARFWDNAKSIFENKSNKVTSISEASTDTEYPSAKAVFDLVGASGGLGDLKIDYGLKEQSSLSKSLSVRINFNVEFINPPIVVITPYLDGADSLTLIYSSAGIAITNITNKSFDCVAYSLNANGKYIKGAYWIAIGT